jgi:hypothetical protein
MLIFSHMEMAVLIIRHHSKSVVDSAPKAVTLLF